MIWNMLWIFPRGIAHRGAGKLAPENTLAAMSYGLGAGFAGVEFDVMLTKDKVPILMHDDVTGRTIKCSKCNIADLTYEEISTLDAGSWLHPKHADVRVPKFTDVLKFCFDNNLWMNIEIKPSPGFETETGEIVAQVTKEFFEPLRLPEEKLPLFSSFAFDSLVAAHRVAPSIKRGYLIDSLREVPDWKEKCKQIEAYALHTNHRLVNPDFVAEVKNEGLGLFCYTVNNVTRAHELIAMGVDSFCTDELEIFKDFPQ